MIAKTPTKAKRRPGPWSPIQPTIVACQVIYVDQIGVDLENAQNGWRSTRPLITTPHQRRSVRRSMEDFSDA